MEAVTRSAVSAANSTQHVQKQFWLFTFEAPIRATQRGRMCDVQKPASMQLLKACLWGDALTIGTFAFFAKVFGQRINLWKRVVKVQVLRHDFLQK
ncbi:hypothetical protein [Pseudomonas amygdali]|uniref:hypothetical protein n=1 Tax=Pseudomonas amygdali TaxID=47877 RepID=UPI001E492D86|nr:hypothetical protein [Pseudomonas amygdali]